MAWIKTFASVIFTMAVLDYIWLGLITSRLYSSELAPIARLEDGKIKPLMWAAVLVYVVMATGLVYFVIPRVTNMSLLLTALTGALFGLIVYGTYDLTNLAILEKWTILISIADIAWGGILCGIATLVGKWVSNL